MNRRCTCVLIACLSVASPAFSDEVLRVETNAFDADPAWEGYRNRLLPDPLPITRQDFGYRSTRHAGGAGAGEIGGRVERSTNPASYAMAIPNRSLDEPLSASGTLAVPVAGGGSGVMIGWFHETSRGWRTPNSLAFRIDGNGGKYWLFYEYGTCNWKTGGGGAFEGEQYQRTPTKPFAAGETAHRWQLDYDPLAADGNGQITFRIDDRSYHVALAPGHRAEGATFNRFGIWNVQTPGDALELYLDDLVVDGKSYAFDADPAWEGNGNAVEFAERVIRPYHDFGFSPTRHCGAAGEIGGIVFRDERPAYYGARIAPLTLDDELVASGKLVLAKAGSDSGAYIGWFDSATKQANETPEHVRRPSNVLGIVLEGPSRVGHYFRPSYSNRAGAGLTADGGDGWPVIRPDGQSHSWRLHYRPGGVEGRGQIELSLDGASRTLDLAPAHRTSGARFDRFGIFNLQSGGHHVELYLDDVSFSRR